MSFSIENRAPFLDRKLFELAYSIPTQFLIKDGKTKAILREAMRGIVDKNIVENTRKVGFNAPIMDLLDTKSSRVREQLLDDSEIFDLVKKEKIESLLQHESLPNSYSKFLFNFLNAKLFVENFG